MISVLVIFGSIVVMTFSAGIAAVVGYWMVKKLADLLGK